jgi:hypothetical protein
MSSVKGPDQDIIQQLLNGLFQQNGLSYPTTVVSCIDDNTAHQIVVFIGTILDKSAKGSVSDIVPVI